MSISAWLSLALTVLWFSAFVLYVARRYEPGRCTTSALLLIAAFSALGMFLRYSAGTP